MPTQHTFPAEAFGPPGIPGKLVIVERSDESPPSDEQAITDNEERDFEVSCAFAKEAGFAKTIRADLEIETGTSFFKPGDTATEGRLRVGDGLYRFIKNSEGVYAGARYLCRARSLDEAREMFWKSLTPALDHMSYLSNTPILIDVEYALDKKNSVFSAGYTTPYSVVTVGIGWGKVHAEMIPIYALYREAKCSLSHFYRFLCYYKILEGIIDSIRPGLFKRAQEQGLEIVRKKDVIPAHPELTKYYPRYVNRSIGELYRNEWLSEYRDAVGHFRLNSGTLLNPSDRAFRAKFADIILPAELAVRVVVDNMNSYFDQFYGAGEVGIAFAAEA